MAELVLGLCFSALSFPVAQVSASSRCSVSCHDFLGLWLLKPITSLICLTEPRDFLATPTKTLRFGPALNTSCLAFAEQSLGLRGQVTQCHGSG